MASFRDHYNHFLGQHYHHLAPSLADATAALQRLGVAKVEPAARLRAIDLGSGTGVYTESLRQMGYQASGIDTCRGLLEKAGQAYPECSFAESDILTYIPQQPVQACLLLGDTINHLPSLTAVHALVQSLAPRMESGGVWVTTFREYGDPRGSERFIDVAANDEIHLSCCLERDGDTIVTTDLLRAKANDWRLETSSYRKLIIAPGMLQELFAGHGFDVTVTTAPKGLTAVVAKKP